MASITFQVEQCVREIDMIGRSKREARKEGKKGVHSHKTKSEVLKIGKQFARWARETHGVKNLHELNERHYLAFMASKSHTTLDYRRSIETHLRLVQEGLQKRAERFEKDGTVFVPEKRLIGPRGRLEGVSDRSYLNDDVQALKERLTPSVCVSVSLMHGLGLRVSESVSVRAVDVQGDHVAVVGKGGRSRMVRIPESYRDELQTLVNGKDVGDRLAPVTAGTVQNALNQACKKMKITNQGTHGFRHTYARNQVERLMTSAEKDLFVNCMQRYAENKPFDYGVHDRELYSSMKSKMDQVHAELGHGKDRFDLAVRYMK